jgi:hypothetical protein
MPAKCNRVVRLLWLAGAVLGWSVLTAPRALGHDDVRIPGQPPAGPQTSGPQAPAGEESAPPPILYDSGPQFLDPGEVDVGPHVTGAPQFAAPGLRTGDASSEFAPLPGPYAVQDAEPVPSLSAPTAWRPCYWVASSRCSAQHPLDRHGCPLDLLFRSPDGRLQRSDIAGLRSQLIPGVPVCVFIHGSFVTIEDHCQESAEAFAAFQQLSGGCPMHAIFFTWPSDQRYTHVLPLDVSINGERADFNAFHLCWLLSQIPEHHPVCLIGHSHGCRTAMATLHLLNHGVIQNRVFTGYTAPARRMRVITTAAAFDHNWLNPGRKYDRALLRVESLLILRNRHDLALAFYPWTRPFARRAFGRTGLTPRDRQLLGWQHPKAHELDVTDLLGHRHYWPDYYSQPQIVASMLPYMRF